MRIAVQGSSTFSDYTIFLRAMRTALYSMDAEDKEIMLYSIGPVRLNNMALEFSNVSEDSLRGRGIKISCRKMPSSWIKDNIKSIDYFAYFCKPGDPVSSLVDLADESDVSAAVYSYA